MDDIAIFCGAGSFGGEFQPLVDAVGAGAWLVRYPGRTGRGFGVPAESFDALVDGCAKQIVDRGAAGTVLLGHSFGAYVAYATALRLPPTVRVSALVPVGATAPALLEVPTRATGTPADAAAYLADIDPDALAAAPSDDWREIVAETVVTDMRLLTGFDTTAAARLPVPILAARGDTDTLAPADGVTAWRRHTEQPCTVRSFPGGHSGVLRTSAFVSWLGELVGTGERRLP
ncbi:MULTISPECIES: thioesterase II family protein [Micromonospora]|uniref:Surfactin synthase thioesterase subunit n=1 Tax=Micromonospora yangpuensis TaxID=683228 RepID=A0A1C6UQ29_9ACTN|nr:alpha/beta fold hydrolase [Micromonospora yangpuensis]GGM08112.1 hypothetical protein GCM10012279_27760 [Micromonospora yangpuensis]SCL56050.1 Surfactin synthase thioesterase subunit [Micromonospora yangpuensis]